MIIFCIYNLYLCDTKRFACGGMSLMWVSGWTCEVNASTEVAVKRTWHKSLLCPLFIFHRQLKICCFSHLCSFLLERGCKRKTQHRLQEMTALGPLGINGSWVRYDWMLIMLRWSRCCQFDYLQSTSASINFFQLFRQFLTVLQAHIFCRLICCLNWIECWLLFFSVTICIRWKFFE